jgi:hypothetical protein
MNDMFGLTNIMFIIVPIIIVIVFVIVIIMFISPKVRGKMMARQIKAARYMLDESKDDLENMGTIVGNTSIKIKKNIIEDNEETLKDINIKEANINKEKVRITAKAIKEGLTEDNSIYCKYCGQEIDSDSIYCKNCGKKL